MKRSTLCGLTQTNHIGHYSVNKHYVDNAVDLAAGLGPGACVKPKWETKVYLRQAVSQCIGCGIIPLCAVYIMKPGREEFQTLLSINI